ncbi:K02A2.6-like [Cordylochernes scorpioides]|uniref:RNA-directed DNA polymerase n=1 Tax=Cordylochernes scorpioides TaxID=51811 RepID=A0ABY6LJV7_9ARAC|nr:K02A2.6-like [Cordylochernes scorpioides]
MGREAQNIFKSFNLNNADKNNLSIVKGKFYIYFSPKLNTTIERFKFNQMKQKEDESFNDFLTRIKLQIANCKYAVMSDELLKDRIVVGIINNEIRERLLSEADLNLEKATQICIACENATNQMKHVLSDSDKQVAVTKMNSKKWEDSKEPRKENTTNQSHKIIENCRNCGRSHKINQCPAYQKRCNKCKKLNHFANLCRSKNTNSYKVRQIVGSPEPEMIQEFVIQSVENTNLTEDWYEEVKIKGKKVNMKLDRGAQCNVLPLSLAGRLNLEIQRSPVKSLISFSGHRIPVEGQSLAMCMVKNMTAYIRFIISRDNTCPILGRQTCSNLGLVKRVNTCQAITQEYQELFEGIGCLKGYEYEAKFQTSDMNMQVRPPRPIPLSIKERVKKELEEMEDNGIIKKINYPTPISSQMVIAKQKGKIRICIDPSDINKVILRSHFPLRTFDQIAVNLHGSKYFTKLDLKKGYWQIKVAPNSQRYFTFSTPWGRYMFLRVPFGIKTAPEIFQKIMADLLQDLEGTENSMDDILIHAPDPQTLEIRTRAVLQRLKENGIKLNRDKCKFQLQEVQFLGHIVTTEGIKIDPEKVRAIGEIKSPSNKQELQRLLGMVQYLSRFIPNLAEKTKNMRLLLKKDTPWLWDESLDCDLLEIKTLLRTAPTLKFFNPNGNLTLSVDASSYALGAVLLQNGKPIAYASSALGFTQQNYAQIEKEALAIKFGCDKFHQLIYGKTVDVETDHRPLETIFKKPLSKAPPRLQRIFLQIQQYDLRIKYKKEKELLTADLLSIDCSYEDTYLEENFEVLMTTPTNKSSYEELQALTKEDQELQELKNLILYGWPNYKSAVPESCKKYWPYRDELSTNEDLIFKGSRVFIPLSRRTRTLLPTSTHQLEPEIQKGHTQNLRIKRKKQKTHHDKTAKTTRSFKEGEKIMLKQHHREWIPARVTQEVAPRSYKVQTPTGEYRRNSSFMRHTNLESPKQQRRGIPEIPKSTLPEGPGPSGDKEQAQVPEELNTSPRAFSGQEPRSDHQNAEHKNGTLPITTSSQRLPWVAKSPECVFKSYLKQKTLVLQFRVGYLMDIFGDSRSQALEKGLQENPSKSVDNSSKSEENLSRSEDNPSKSEEIPSKSKKSHISKLTPQITSKQNQLLPSESGQPSTPEQPLASQSSEPLSSKKETSIIPKIRPPPYYRRKRQLPAEKTSWDEPIESDIKSNWNKFQTQLSCLKEIKIPRYLNSSSSEIEELQLHGFFDASLNAYSAVFYLKTRFKIQKIKINLITSKTKVAPLKTITIPRLELSAALLLAKLNQVILESFPFQPDKTFLWTDSQFCIDWIRSDASRWKAFVSNRVSSIQNLTQITDWFHVSSQDNPADCASRGIMPQDLVNHRIWWRGPIWLQENNVRYIPSSPTQVNLNIIQEEVAWCWRFYYNCLLFDPIRQKGPLTTRELTKAIQVLVKSIQQVEFCTEIKLLKSNKQLPLSNKLTSLNPFLDTQGLLRVGGRLKYSYLNENQKFPLLQPKSPRQESLIKNLLTENADIPEAIDENQEDSSILETNFVIEDEESNKDIGTPKIEISEVSVIDKSEGKYSKEPVVSVEALDKKELCHDDSAHLNVVEADLNRPKEATSGIINVYTEANESSSKEKVVPVEIVDTSTKDYLQSGEKAKLSRWKPIDSLCLEDVKESEDDDENYSSSAYIEWPEILKKEVLGPEALEKAVNLEDFEKAAESRQLSKEHLEESTEQGSCIKAESKTWEDPIESDLAAAESDNPAVPEKELANESENLIQDSPQSDTQRWKLIPLPFKQ